MFSSNVKFTLVSFAAMLLFAGTAIIAADGVSSPTSRVSRIDKNDATEERQATLFPADGKFLASLRFWEKKQKPPATVANDNTQFHETPSASQNTPDKQPTTLVPNCPVTTDSAPEPPSSPYVESEPGELGDAPLPGQTTHFAYKPGNSEAATQRDPKPGATSYMSYSFDTRDWVEFFPIQQEQDATPEEILATTQKTSLRLSDPHTPLTQHLTTEEDNWNGQSTTLVTHVQPAPLQTAIPVPQIDLSPSYQKRLPYVQTCGVVVVQANFPLTEITAILDEINLLQHDLNSYIGVPEPKEKIELCLFKDEASYSSFLKEFFPRAPTDRRALYVKLTNKPGTLMVQKTNDFEIDLRHEMTHAIVHATIPNVPIWLDEGLAKYFEVPPPDRASQSPYMSRVRWNAKVGLIPSLDRLVKLETIDDMQAKEYQDSWAWTHFLIHRSPETQRLLAAYLRMLANWTPRESARTNPVVGLFAGDAKSTLAPSLKLYLDDIVPNQREAFKEHFGAGEK